MSLHLTKVAYGATSLVDLIARVEGRVVEEGRMFMTTRYIPKRHAEIAGQGSLYWIIKHQLVARAAILGFEERDDNRWNILLDPCVTPVRPYARRAHQGWRYLEAKDAPPDLLDGSQGGDDLPLEMASELADLSLI